MNLVLFLVISYLFCGLVFAIPFVIRGVQRVDEGARGAGIGFRLLILPGSIFLWPLLLRKWAGAKKEGGHD